MEAWLILAFLSGLTGAIVAKLLRNPFAVVVAAAIAWFGMLAWLLYNEYFVPYQGGGASMWPIAQMFGGTCAAIVAGATAGIIVAFTPKRTPEASSDSGKAKQTDVL